MVKFFLFSTLKTFSPLAPNRKKKVRAGEANIKHELFFFLLLRFLDFILRISSQSFEIKTKKWLIMKQKTD